MDGAERYLTTPYSLRSSTRFYPYAEERDGLYPEDINGDGLILQMRLKDPNGAWKCSDKDARIMRRREMDEEDGTYYHLMTEGLIRNYDGFTIPVAPPRQGLDINRNYPFEWAPEGTQRGAGPYPFSEPETRAQAEFWRTHPNISGFLTYHTSSGVLLRPYSTKPDDAMPPEDLDVFTLLGQRGTQLTGYPCVSTYHGFRYGPREVTHGAMDDYVYDHFGWFGFTTELWDLPTTAGIGPRDFIAWLRWHPEEDDLALMRWNDAVMEGAAFVDWQPFQHPQLGPVDIGGWHAKLFQQNAPLKYLPELCEQHSRFTLAHAALCPYLSLRTVQVESCGPELFHVVVVVQNNGFLPTYTSQKALERKCVRPIEVALTLPEGVSLVSGQLRQDVGHLEGRANKVWARGAGSSPTDHLCKLAWVLKGPQGATVDVTVRSQRAGVVRRSIVLIRPYDMDTRRSVRWVHVCLLPLFVRSAPLPACPEDRNPCILIAVAMMLPYAITPALTRRAISSGASPNRPRKTASLSAPSGPARRWMWPGVACNRTDHTGMFDHAEFRVRHRDRIVPGP